MVSEIVAADDEVDGSWPKTCLSFLSVKIGVNLFFWHPHCGGVGNYVATLLREWPQLFPEDQLVLARTDGAAAFVNALRAAPNAYRDLRLESLEQIVDHLDAFDVWFNPFGHYSPRPVAKPTVLALMDIQERFFPQFFEPDDLAFRLRHYDSSLQHADRIITISEFSRESIVRIIGIPRRKIDRISLCADELPPPVRPIALPAGWPEAFLFFPANAWTHKNHARFLIALELLRNRGLVTPCVLTGVPPPENSELAASLRHAPEETLQHLGLICRAELCWLYHHARALVFPSLFEGFGLPVVEAMLCGCPVACAHTTSLPEVAGTAAEFFDPTDPESIATAIDHLWTNQTLREQLRARGTEQVRRFDARTMVRAHRLSFQKAIQSHTGLWQRVRKRFAGPPDERNDTALTRHEKTAAARLLGSRIPPCA
ncbi:MAG: glycosyltransferase family 4 protein [Verrucomicrobia bacterium]|nr:glycosyltransferase family 4 protein [Verrucomicrobiota bacterium]